MLPVQNQVTQHPIIVGHPLASSVVERAQQRGINSWQSLERPASDVGFQDISFLAAREDRLRTRLVGQALDSIVSMCKVMQSLKHNSHQAFQPEEIYRQFALPDWREKMKSFDSELRLNPEIGAPFLEAGTDGSFVYYILQIRDVDRTVLTLLKLQHALGGDLLPHVAKDFIAGRFSDFPLR